MWVAGVDGCRGGWIVALVKRSAEVQHRLCRTFQEVLDLKDPRPDVIAIDIPIGLLETPRRGGRICDQLARRELSAPRGSSVFTPPLRCFLAARSFSEVTGMTIQTFGILKKIAEVDRLMTPEVQKRVYEAHPELAFRLLVGHSMQFKKSRSSGRDERICALAQIGPTFNGLGKGLADQRMTFSGKDLAADDLLDAYALTWSALRIATGQATRLPTDPPHDCKGLRMEIWY